MKHSTLMALVCTTALASSAMAQQRVPSPRTLTNHDAAQSGDHERDDDPPVNDLCGSVAPQALIAGTPLIFSGSTVDATVDGDYAFGDFFPPAVWHAFTTTGCGTITISYCPTSETFLTVSPLLMNDCPAEFMGWTTADIYDGETCWPNTTLTFHNLPAGTYYYPVWSLPASSYGLYTISVNAVGCTEPCAITSEIGPTDDAHVDGVVLGSLSNVNSYYTPGVAHVVNTTTTTILQPGLNYTISVRAAAAMGELMSAWIDFNGDLSFSPEERLGEATSAVPGQTIPFTFTVPADAVLGATTLRVRVVGGEDLSTYAPVPISPCYSYEIGETEDYTVTISLPTGMADAQATAWSVYPNPGNGDLTLRYAAPSTEVMLEVMDMTGRTVYAERRYLVQGAEAHLALAGELSAGSYILRLTSGMGRKEQRIVVR